MAKLHFDLVSPERLLISAEVDQVDVPGSEGDFGVLPLHAPVMTTLKPGVLTVFDNTSAAGANVIAFAGGSTSLSNLSPISIPVGAFSTAGPWKVTTGANMVATCYGKFS